MLQLFTLLFIILTSLIQQCDGSPAYQEEYRGDYVPEFIESWYGPQVVAPDSPYVAVAGRNQLYFIDTRHDAKTAAHIKEQIERAAIPGENEYLFVDEELATAEKRNSLGETVFVFDPPYARVFFAHIMNERSPNLKLPEHTPAGDQLVTYNTGTALTKRQYYCRDFGCYIDHDCIRQSRGNCDVCSHGRVDNDCVDTRRWNSIGACHPLQCSVAVDTPKQDGETDIEYYQRMDKLHWG